VTNNSKLSEIEENIKIIENENISLESLDNKLRHNIDNLNVEKENYLKEFNDDKKKFEELSEKNKYLTSEVRCII